MTYEEAYSLIKKGKERGRFWCEMTEKAEPDGSIPIVIALLNQELFYIEPTRGIGYSIGTGETAAHRMSKCHNHKIIPKELNP